MNAPDSGSVIVPTRSWGQVEKSTSLFLLFVLLCVLGMRLSFSVVWPMPRLDFVLSAVALVLLVASFRMVLNHRNVRLCVIAFAGATQLVPMVVREPVLLFPLLAGMIPVAILIGCLIALSRKDLHDQPQSRS